jgi:UDP-N-acetylglucosamine 2-epimerase
MRKIAVCVGTRPQVVKTAAIVPELIKQGIKFDFINTGQHYDYEMDKIFFEEFSLPKPINLSVGSGDPCWQIGTMMVLLEKLFKKNKYDIAMCLGDTNSTLAEALAAFECGIPLWHIEAGARCGDKSMREEMNRILTDHVSTLLFSVSRHCTENLLKEGFDRGRVHEVGDVMYDVFLKYQDKFGSVMAGQYCVLTVHRAENLIKSKLRKLMYQLSQLDIDVVFLVHPHTRKILDSLVHVPDNIVEKKPLGYFEMMGLVSEAEFVVTDSGGLQKEAFWHGVPCITIRNETEWTEISQVNMLCRNLKDFQKCVDWAFGNHDFPANPYGDGHASERIVQLIEEKMK